MSLMKNDICTWLHGEVRDFDFSRMTDGTWKNFVGNCKKGGGYNTPGALIAHCDVKSSTAEYVAEANASAEEEAEQRKNHAILHTVLRYFLEKRVVPYQSGARTALSSETPSENLRPGSSLQACP